MDSTERAAIFVHQDPPVGLAASSTLYQPSGTLPVGIASVRDTFAGPGFPILSCSLGTYQVRVRTATDIFFDFNAPILTDSTGHTIAAEPLGEVIPHPWLGKVGASSPLTVFPNPFSDQTRFRFGDARPHSQVAELYDLSGRLVRQQSFSEARQFTFRREQLVAGVYTYRIAAKEEVGTGEIILQR